MEDRPKRLLVIDDETMIGVMVKALVRRMDPSIEVRAEEEGEAALLTAIEFGPSLILLDVRMPGLDGFEVLRRLRAQKGCEDIPVVFMTGLGTLDIQKRIQETDAKGFIWKPPKLEDIRSVIRTYLLV